MSPEGPEPTIATGGLVATCHGSGTPPNRWALLSGLTSFSRSGRYHSSWPIWIGSLLCRQTPWHWSSCGQTRPVTSGSGLEPSMSSMASRNRPMPTSSSICGMWILTGQPPVGSFLPTTWMPISHGFSAHCLSRRASSQTKRSTSTGVYPSVR